MKRLLVVFMAVLLTVAFVGGVYAQSEKSRAAESFDTKLATAKAMTVEGDIVSHDVKCHCFVVKGAKGNVVIQDDYAEFNQNYDRAKGLKIGAKAKVTYKTVDSMNYATKIEQ
jgi:hypothetical protein